MTTTEAKTKPAPKLKDLFYCHSEKVVFWVAGYTLDNNTRKVAEQIKYLTENAQKFAEAMGCRFEQVKTETILKSRRYKYMRVFWTESPQVPDGAFELGENRTMWTWLND